MYNYIQNSMLVGNTVRAVDLRLPDVTWNNAKNEIDGAVELNSMYFKIDDRDNIVLVLCQSESKYLDFGDVIDKVGPYAFYNNDNIQQMVTLSVKSIGHSAFRSSSIKHIVLPSVTYIGEYCFASSEIVSINAPVLKLISAGAFAFCHDLVELDLPKVREIGANAFDYCSIKRLSVPELDAIKPATFICCYELMELYAPKVKYVHNGAFYDCNNLSNVTYSPDVFIEESNV